MNRRLSVIIPTLNEEASIASTLKALQTLRTDGHQIILVDGGSNDRTVERAKSWVDQLLLTRAGRASQMNAGAAAAIGDLYWFLHADTRVDRCAIDGILEVVHTGDRWGRFDVRLSGSHPLLRLIEFMMNWRSRITGIATGDQGIFVPRALFESVGGFPCIALMEDIAISRLLKRFGRPLCVPQVLVSSSRRWERNGLLRTMVLMWRLRLAYTMGVDPARLAEKYERSG